MDTPVGASNVKLPDPQLVGQRWVPKTDVITKQRNCGLEHLGARCENLGASAQKGENIARPTEAFRILEVVTQLRYEREAERLVHRRQRLVMVSGSFVADKSNRFHSMRGTKSRRKDMYDKCGKYTSNENNSFAPNHRSSIPSDKLTTSTQNLLPQASGNAILLLVHTSFARLSMLPLANSSRTCKFASNMRVMKLRTSIAVNESSG